MKTIKLTSKTVAIAALLLTTSAARATVTPTTAIEVVWQWLFPAETQPELKTCANYPRCGNNVAPTPESTTAE